LLTDNGSQFTDRFTSKQKDLETGDRIPRGKYAFDMLCKQLAIVHRLIMPRHPQTNGMVDRLNGRISVKMVLVLRLNINYIKPIHTPQIKLPFSSLACYLKSSHT